MFDKYIPEIWTYAGQRSGGGDRSRELGYLNKLSKALGFKVRAFYPPIDGLNSEEIERFTKYHATQDCVIEAVPDEGADVYFTNKMKESGVPAIFAGEVYYRALDSLDSRLENKHLSYNDNIRIPAAPMRVKRRVDADQTMGNHLEPAHAVTPELLEEKKQDAQRLWGDLPKPCVLVYIANPNDDSQLGAVRKLVNDKFRGGTLFVISCSRSNRKNNGNGVKGPEHDKFPIYNFRADESIKEVTYHYHKENGNNNPLFEMLSSDLDAIVVFGTSGAFVTEAAMTRAPILYLPNRGSGQQAAISPNGFRDTAREAMGEGQAARYVTDVNALRELLDGDIPEKWRKWESYDLTERVIRRDVERYREYQIKNPCLPPLALAVQSEIASEDDEAGKAIPPVYTARLAQQRVISNPVGRGDKGK